MPSLIYSAHAIDDLKRLVAFLKAKNPQAAARAAAKIDASLLMLEQHPQLGRAVEDMPPEFRELLIPFGSYGYVARYRYTDGAGVEVLAVRHCREVGFAP